MNYLAHSALSGQVDLFTVGNFIADHVRGTDLSRYPPQIAQGIRFHRMIDQKFDNHKSIIELRTNFPQGHRRYSGIILDMWFDHLLAKHWQDFYSTPLSAFQTSIANLLQQNNQVIPNSQRRFIDYFISQELFVKYQSQAAIKTNILLMSQRLSCPEQFIAAFQFFENSSIDVSETFQKVFPDMMKLRDDNAACFV